MFALRRLGNVVPVIVAVAASIFEYYDVACFEFVNVLVQYFLSILYGAAYLAEVLDIH